MTPQAKRVLCSAASVAFGVVVLLAGGPAGAAPTASANRLMPAQSVLALRLLDKLAAKQPGANLVVSPASLAGALSVIERGVASQQHAKLHELLGFKNVVLSPHIAAQPRFNALNDISDMLAGLAKDVAP